MHNYWMGRHKQYFIQFCRAETGAPARVNLIRRKRAAANLIILAEWADSIKIKLNLIIRGTNSR